jgi:hypothetical protein
VYLFFIIIFFFYTKQQSIFKRRTTLDVWRRWWLVEFCFHNNKYILFLSRKRSVHVIKCRRNLCRSREAVFVRSFHWDFNMLLWLIRFKTNKRRPPSVTLQQVELPTVETSLILYSA